MRFSIIGALALALLILSWLLLTHLVVSPQNDAPNREQSTLSDTGEEADSLKQASMLGAPPSGLSYAGSDTKQLAEELRNFLRDLRNGLSVSEAKARRQALQESVHGLPPDAAAATIIAQLRSGEDAATGLQFVIGPEGIMAETPTYRTELLNLLGQTDPFQASDYSRELMGSTSSPDEYALALRNLAWADFQGNQKDDLRSFFSAMLGREDWRSEPTAGFLEAFDVAVFTGSANLVAEVIEPASSADGRESLISRAGFVALDRMMLSKRPAVLDAFRQNPDFLSHAPFHRASVLSRLDPREGEELALLESYLLRSDHAPGELAYFSEVFPNGNRFISHRLITSWESGGSIMDVAELDTAVLQSVHLWLQDSRFGPRRNELAAIAKRLEEFLGSSASN